MLRRGAGFPPPRLGGVIYNVFFLLLAGGYFGPHDRAKESSTRLLIGWGLIFNIVFMGAFQVRLQPQRECSPVTSCVL